MVERRGRLLGSDSGELGQTGWIKAEGLKAMPQGGRSDQLHVLQGDVVAPPTEVGMDPLELEQHRLSETGEQLPAGVVHLGHLHHTLTVQQLGQLGQMDIVLVPVDGSYTLDLDGMITRTYTLDQINEGYQDMRDGKNIRGVIVH